MGGLPGSPPQDFIPHLFWSCVITTGHVWRRLIRPYRMPPLCLARLVDVNTSAAGKRQLADWVMNLPECCQCEEFLKPLRTIVHSSRDLLSGEGYECLVAAFQTKNVNIEVLQELMQCKQPTMDIPQSLKHCLRNMCLQRWRLFIAHVSNIRIILRNRLFSTILQLPMV